MYDDTVDKYSIEYLYRSTIRRADIYKEFCESLLGVNYTEYTQTGPPHSLALRASASLFLRGSLRSPI